MKDLSLYIHIPFCKSRCAYCGFTTFAGKDGMINKYVGSLNTEIAERAQSFQNHRIVSVYFGGGTPSYPPAEEIINTFNIIKKNYALSKNAEVTIECNPESLNEEKILQYKSAGFNRLSMGIQSLNDKTLKRIGRTHDSKTALKAIKTAKKHFKNFSLDFIIGLPYQHPSNFKKDLDQINSFEAPHLSFYFLSPDTKAIDTFINDCPPEEEQIEMYEAVAQKMVSNEYIRYEISNYAKPGYECIHNQRYWDQKEYLGLGLAAHSFFDDTVYENTRSLAEYLKNPLERKDSLILNRDLLEMDYIMMKMRTFNGIEKNEFNRRFENLAGLLKKAGPYIETKLLVETPTHLRPSQKGILILDKIIDDLI